MYVAIAKLEPPHSILCQADENSESAIIPGIVPDPQLKSMYSFLKSASSNKVDENVYDEFANILSNKYLTFIQGLNASSNLCNCGNPPVPALAVVAFLILPTQLQNGYFNTCVLVAPSTPANDPAGNGLVNSKPVDPHESCMFDLT